MGKIVKLAVLSATWLYRTCLISFRLCLIQAPILQGDPRRQWIHAGSVSATQAAGCDGQEVLPVQVGSQDQELVL